MEKLKSNINLRYWTTTFNYQINIIYVSYYSSYQYDHGQYQKLSIFYQVYIFIHSLASYNNASSITDTLKKSIFYCISVIGLYYSSSLFNLSLLTRVVVAVSLHLPTIESDRPSAAVTLRCEELKTHEGNSFGYCSVEAQNNGCKQCMPEMLLTIYNSLLLYDLLETMASIIIYSSLPVKRHIAS